MEADFVLGGIGRSHPWLDAVKRRVIGERPCDEAGLGRRHVVGAKPDGDGAGAAFLAEHDFAARKRGVKGVDKRRIAEALLGRERRTGD